MADFDFTVKRQVPNFNLPPEVYQLLAQAVQQKNQMYQGLGQSLGQGVGSGIQAYGQQKEKKQREKKWGSAVDQLTSQEPQIAPFGGMLKGDPSLAGQVIPGLMKQPKPQMEWSPVSGMLSKDGRPLEIDKTTGEIKEAGPAGSKSTGYGSTMGPIRTAQYTMQDLPSNQGPNTSGGAAYQVKVAARQGKSIIAKAGSAQRTGLGSADLARAILRAAPTEETLHNANFSDNLVTRFSRLKQKITANPDQVNNPQIRKEMYSLFDELDKAAEPWIKNQLDEMKDQGFPVSEKTYRRQLGLDIPDIPFIELPNQPGATATPRPQTGAYSDPGKEARYQAWKKAHGQ